MEKFEIYHNFEIKHCSTVVIWGTRGSGQFWRGRRTSNSI
jgi:hypothetical protein